MIPFNATETLPGSLYKYRSDIDQIRDILYYNRLWFASPRTFNDSLDCRSLKIDLTGTTHQQRLAYNVRGLRNIQRCHPGEFSESLLQELVQSPVFRQKVDDPAYYTEQLQAAAENAARRMGILCMSENGDDASLWNKYADKGNGISLKFDTTALFDNRYTCIRVRYYPGNTVPEIDIISTPPEEKAAVCISTKKHADRNEHEYRIIYHDGIGLHTFNRKALTGIITGPNMSPKNRQLLTAILAETHFDIPVIPSDCARHAGRAPETVPA